MGVLSERPRIADRFAVVPVVGDEFRLRSLTAGLALGCATPGLLSRLLPLLDGRRSVADLVAELREFAEDRVRSVLDQLQAEGVLADDTAPYDGPLSSEERERYLPQITFFSNFAGASQAEADDAWPDAPRDALGYQERLHQACVGVFGLGRLGSQLVRLLALAGVGRLLGVDPGEVGPDEAHSDGWFDGQHVGRKRGDALRELVASANPWARFTPLPGDVATPSELDGILGQCTFAVLCTDHFNPEQYQVFNRACLRSGTPWISCRLTGFDFDIGPTVIPYKTPCFHCFDLRQKRNLGDYEEYLILEGYLKNNPLRCGALAVTPGIGLAALEVVKALTHFMEPATYAHLCSLNLLTLELKRHPILKIPRCPHCGRPARDRPTVQIWDLSGKGP